MNKDSKKNKTIGEMVNVPDGRVYNFADNEENYFAVADEK
jgi:lactoylglutathione lyase